MKTSHSNFCRVLLFAGLGLLTCNGTLWAADEKAPLVLAPMPPARARMMIEEWLSSQPTVDQETRNDVARMWDELPEAAAPRDVLNLAISTFARVDAATGQLFDRARISTVVNVAELIASIDSPGVQHPFYQANARAMIAELLAQRRLYEESLDVIKSIDTTQLIDPAAYLFYKGVSEHALLQQEAGLQTLDRLLKHTEGVPVRFQVLANLMREDLSKLSPKTLYEVERQMNDVERRLDLGRSGKKVQKVEDDIIATLDELIKKLEEQQQGGGGGGGSGQGGNQNQSSNPAQDSTIKGSTAPGNIDPKSKKDTGVWGELPPKKEAAVKNLIDRNYPAHYRQALEQYSKKLSRRKATPGR